MKKLKLTLQFKVILILLIISLMYSFYFNITFKSKYTNENIIYGYINYYLIDGDKLSLELYGKEKILCNYYFSNIDELNEFKNTYKLGDYIRIEGSLKEPSKNTIFNNFNYKEYLRYEKINYLFGTNKIIKLKGNNKLRYKIKNIIIEKIDKNVNKDYLNAFILGNNKYIDKDIMDSYRINGISHLFAVSGMHVSLISLILLKIFDKFKFKNILVMFVIIFYMFLTDFTPSILRAGIFFILIFFNKKFNLKISNVELMLILFPICIFIDPFIIHKIGFQYSFIISFTLILFSKIINNMTGKIKKLFIISFISFIVSIPITANNFYEINFLSIILNIFFVPIVSSFILPITFLSLIIPLDLFKYFIDIFELISLSLSKLNFFVIILPKINLFVIITYYIVIYYVLYNIKLKKCKSIILLIIVIFIHFISPSFNNNMEITFIDVGQGDSILIRIPNNKYNILIDTGGSINYEKANWKNRNSNYSISRSIITYLKSIGISKLDYLILSHGDYDHMGESINLVNDFKMDKVIFNVGDYNELEQELIKVLDKKQIPYYSCIKELNIDDNKLYFLNNKDYGNENDNSSIIYTQLNNHKFLFMGDAGVEVEKDLIEKYNLNDIDVLKVGHHGSKTSSSELFIDEINPKYSIISVGKNNRYGHPNYSVLDNLENSKIYRTDEDGSIMFKIKNEKLKIETCAP